MVVPTVRRSRRRAPNKLNGSSRRPVFGRRLFRCLAIAALAGVILNAILPGNDYEFGKSVEGDASADLGSY